MRKIFRFSALFVLLYVLNVFLSIPAKAGNGCGWDCSWSQSGGAQVSCKAGAQCSGGYCTNNTTSHQYCMGSWFDVTCNATQVCPGNGGGSGSGGGSSGSGSSNQGTVTLTISNTTPAVGNNVKAHVTATGGYAGGTKDCTLCNTFLNPGTGLSCGGAYTDPWPEWSWNCTAQNQGDYTASETNHVFNGSACSSTLNTACSASVNYTVTNPVTVYLPSCLAFNDNGSDINFTYAASAGEINISTDNFTHYSAKVISTSSTSTDGTGFSPYCNCGLPTWLPNTTYQARVYGGRTVTSFTTPESCYHPPTTPTVSSAPACFPAGGDKGSDITISWTNQTRNITWVDISKDPNFSHFSNYNVNPSGSTSMTANKFNDFSNSRDGPPFYPNTIYYIRTWDDFSHSPTYTFNSLPGCRPIVVTNQATSVTCNSANINGFLTSADPVSGWFRYGTSNAACSALPNVTENRVSGVIGTWSFSKPLSSLSAVTTYYFCAVAANSTGTGYDSVLQFTTTSCFSPWIQTSGGDVHSNENISTHRGP